jgi:hypothetical protein
MTVPAVNPTAWLRASQPVEEFIVPADPAEEKELRSLPGDAWLEAAQMELTIPNFLRFANRYGILNPDLSRHCHTDSGKLLSPAEPVFHWFHELGKLKRMFHLWRRLVAKRPPAKDSVLAEFRDHLKDRCIDPKILLWPVLIGEIDMHLQPSIVDFPKCEIEGCPYEPEGYPRRMRLGIQFGLAYRDAVSVALVAPTLISSLWFQFAQSVAGKRALRRCHHCRQWMDVTSERGNKKLYHPRCSATLKKRMQRERLKGKEDGATQKTRR